MRNKRSFVWIAALAFLVLFLGPASSKSYAWDSGPRVAFYGQFGLPHGSVRVYANNGRFYHRPYGRHFYRPYYSSFYRPYYRPYRLARFYVYDPYPHWVFRRVYYGPRLGYSYGSPY